MKSGILNFLEPSGPFQACNGTDLPLHHSENAFFDMMLCTQMTASAVDKPAALSKLEIYKSNLTYSMEQS